jgi:hypothetical protein
VDFLIKELDISFNHKELIEYVEILEKDFQHLKWMPTEENLKTIKDYEKHNYTGLYGWSIQSNLEDLTIPCPPYDVHKNGSTVYRDTELMFGFVLKLKQLFPGIRQLGITAHPANVRIAEHIDNTEYIKIHIPVTSNPQSYFTFGDKQFVMEPGKMYLVNTTETHATNNLGDSVRIHMLFKVPTEQWLEVSQITAIL